MTIGIAAYGPEAGRGIVRALAAVEAVGRGAIGGFVSAVALTSDGGLVRAETQRGGSSTLFGGDDALAETFATARIAVLMSSGPDRPTPLSQFTPGRPGIGLVTGHRMPNTIGSGGVRLNEEVVALMSSGLSPHAAVEQVVAQNPAADAGLIALSVGGRMHLADTAYVRSRGDRGSRLAALPDGSAIVGVIHNAILPHRPLAALATEVALDAMGSRNRPTDWITLGRGVPLTPGERNSVYVGEDGVVQRIVVTNRNLLVGRWDVGVGFETPVINGRGPFAVLLYEPYLVSQDGVIESIDGGVEMVVPIRNGVGS